MACALLPILCEGLRLLAVVGELLACAGRTWSAGPGLPAADLVQPCRGGAQPGDLGAGADGLRRYRSGRGLLSLPLPGLPSFRPGCRREGFYAPGLVS